MPEIGSEGLSSYPESWEAWDFQGDWMNGPLVGKNSSARMLNVIHIQSSVVEDYDPVRSLLIKSLTLAPNSYIH